MPAHHRFRFHHHALALAASLALPAMPSIAGVAATGVVNTGPVAMPIGPGDTVIPSTGVWVGGSGQAGSLSVDGGSFMQAARWSFGSGGTGNGSGWVSGAGTQVQLVGDGFSNSQVQRLVVGDWGQGSLTVAAGALLDTSTAWAPCLLQFHYCDSFVGGAAGDVASLVITGAGSRVRTASNLFVGHPGLAVPALNGYTYGTPGATVSATLKVLDGAELTTDRAQIGTRQWDNASTGYERSVSNVSISGAGSRWRVVGGQTWDGVTGAVINPGAGIITANDRFAVTSIDIANGGQMRIEGVNGIYNYINLTSGGGRTDMTVRGSGSALSFSGDAAVLQVGRTLGSAMLSVSDSAQVNGLWYLSVGRDGSFGEMVVDGAASRVIVDGRASAAANGSLQNALLDIGRNGTGKLSINNGARLELLSNTHADFALQLSVGRDAASSGTLNISGAGSTLLARADSVGAGAGEAFNPFVRIGRDGSGTLNISGGGKLLLEGNAVSTVVDTRRTSLFIGGSGDSSIGGKGIASVTGAGSEIKVSGSDAYIGVGHGPQASGQLTLANQAQASATIMAIGNYGGTGVASFDQARVDLKGQYTGSGEFGAALVVGAGNGGVGVLSASNGSVIHIENLGGSGGGGVSIGGSRTLTGGDGSMTLSASTLEVVMPPGLAGVSVGRSGTGMLRLKDGSTLAMAGSSLFVGRLSGSDGTLIATGGSTITAGWVGVGRDRSNGVDSDGGTATVVLNGATLNADNVVIGTNGFLGGTAGAINVSGSIVNYGIFSPGNSPGLFSINGNYSAGAGSRLILEVQSDGAGGFLTDEVRFGAGGAIDLAALNVEFRFLGSTDPNAFQASGAFDIDTFVRQAAADGTLAGLDAAGYAGVHFSARADAYAITGFSYSAEAGASFSATPVPEPASWWLMGAGLAWLARRRSVGRA